MTETVRDADRVLSKIRGLIQKAEGLEALGDPESLNEADACRAAADKMMQKYAVEEWQTMRAASVQTKPTRVKIEIGEEDNEFLAEMASLVNIVARFCKCSSIWMAGSAYRASGRQEYCWVYGYESDLRYFELMFTNLFLHFGGAIFPKPDPAKTLGQNAYELHNAGLNWVDIAKVYGWHLTAPFAHEPATMLVNHETGERRTYPKSAGMYKKAYEQEIARRGEPFLRIAPNGSKTFRINAAQGYLNRIRQRLDEIAGQRGAGAELVLADKGKNIDEAMLIDFPGMTVGRARKGTYNAEAYARGTKHANTANLNPAAGSAPRKAI
jgi:hypothetical protein